MEVDPIKFCQQVMDEINYVRANPKTYAKRIRSYINSFDGLVLRLPGMNGLITTEGPSAYEEAAVYLENAVKNPMLSTDVGLCNACIGMVNELKLYTNINEMQSINREAIIGQYGTFEGEFGQSTDFGSIKPEMVVMNFLVDDGDKARRNRDMMFRTAFKAIGCATIKHDRFRMCTVVMFAKKFNKGKTPVTYQQSFKVKEDDQYENTLDREEDMEYRQGQGQGQGYEQAYNQANGQSDERGYGQGGQGVKAMPMQNPGYSQSHVEKEKAPRNKYNDFDLPPGVLKMEESEKFTIENGIKKRIVRIIKYMDTGEKKTEIFKEDVQ